MELLNLNDDNDNRGIKQVFKDLATIGNLFKNNSVNLLGSLNKSFYNIEDYKSHYMLAIEKLENCIKSGNHDELPSIYCDLVNVSFHMKDYSQVRYYSEKAYKFVTFNKVNSKDNIMKNIICLELLSYDEEKRYANLLEKSNKIKELLESCDKDILIGIMMLEAKANMGLKRYKEAIEIYKSLLQQESSLDINKRKAIYLQLSIACRYVGEKEESNTYFYKACNVIDLQQQDLYIQLLIEQAERNLKTKHYDEAISALQEIGGILEGHYINDGLLDVYSLMGEVYADMGNLEESKDCFGKIKNLLQVV